MVVSVTSNAHRTYKKGQVAIPREAIAGLRLIKMHKRGRIIGTSVGTVLGLAGAETIARGTEGFLCGGIFESCPPNPNYDLERVGFAAMAALPVAGYFIGRWTDRQEIRITILPD